MEGMRWWYGWYFENVWDPTSFYADEKHHLMFGGNISQRFVNKKTLENDSIFFIAWNKIALDYFLCITDFILRISSFAKIIKILMNTIYCYHELKEWQMRKGIFPKYSHMC